MQQRLTPRRLSITVAAFALSVAAGVSFALAHTTPDGPRSDVAAARVIRTHGDANDAQMIASMRLARHEAARRARHIDAVSAPERGPSVAQVLIFFHVLLSESPHETASAPASEAFIAASLPVAPPLAPVAPAPAATATPILPPPPATPAADVWTDASFTQEVWDGVNARRTQLGLAPVAVDTRLARAASDYAVLISETHWFSHTGPDASSFVDRITAAGFPFEGQLGEVLAMGTDGWPAAGVVQAWIDSPPHREQLLNPDYRLAGLACAFTREAGRLTVRCVMEFAA